MPTKDGVTTSTANPETVKTNAQGMLTAALTQGRGLATAMKATANKKQNVDGAYTYVLPPIDTRAAQNHVRYDQEALLPSNSQGDRGTRARGTAKQNTENTPVLPKLNLGNTHNTQQGSSSIGYEEETPAVDYVLVGQLTPSYRDKNDLSPDAMIQASAAGTEAKKEEGDNKRGEQGQPENSLSGIDSSDGDGIISVYTEDFDDCDVGPVTEVQKAKFATGVTQYRTVRTTKSFAL